MTDDHVEFENPPVREAVIGIEFNPLPLSIIDLAKLTDEWRAEFPIVQEQPALDPSTAVAPGAGGPGIHFGSGVPPVRLWLIEPSGHFLIQLQRDRLLLNWRKVAEDSEYPRYAVLRDKFAGLLSGLRGFLRSNHPGADVSMTVAEFTYINRIAAEGSADTVFSVLREPTTPLPGQPLVVRFQEIRNVHHSESAAPGQLSISTEPAVVNGVAEIQLTVSTKFFPTAISGDASMLGVLDEARNVSRQAFVAFTTESMHANWGGGSR